jgi:hypothetical protein
MKPKAESLKPKTGIDILDKRSELLISKILLC